MPHALPCVHFTFAPRLAARRDLSGTGRPGLRDLPRAGRTRPHPSADCLAGHTHLHGNCHINVHYHALAHPHCRPYTDSYAQALRHSFCEQAAPVNRHSDALASALTP